MVGMDGYIRGNGWSQIGRFETQGVAKNCPKVIPSLRILIGTLEDYRNLKTGRKKLESLHFWKDLKNNWRIYPRLTFYQFPGMGNYWGYRAQKIGLGTNWIGYQKDSLGPQRISQNWGTLVQLWFTYSRIHLDRDFPPNLDLWGKFPTKRLYFPFWGESMGSGDIGDF